MLAQMSKAIAELFVFVYFDQYYTESGSPHWGFFEGGAYCQKRTRGRGLIESLRYRKESNFIHEISKVAMTTL